MKPRDVVLIDGSNLVYRAHWGFRDLRTTSGAWTSVLHGFPSILLRLLRISGKADIVIVWDRGVPGVRYSESPRPLWRTLIDQRYKAHRERTAETRKAQRQLPALRGLLDAMGFLQIGVCGMEADDLMGIGSRKLRDQRGVGLVYLLSNDQDLYQLAGRGVRILTPIKRGLKELTAASILSDTGVSPRNWARYKALAGDPSDGYKAIPGVGPVTAKKLLAGGLDPVVADWRKLPESVRVRYQRYESFWSRVVRCFLLSHIPRSVEWRFLPEAERAETVVEMGRLLRLRSRTMTKTERGQRFRKMLGICSEYELDFLVSRYREFFAGVELVA